MLRLITITTAGTYALIKITKISCLSTKLVKSTITELETHNLVSEKYNAAHTRQGIFREDTNSVFLAFDNALTAKMRVSGSRGGKHTSCLFLFLCSQMF